MNPLVETAIRAHVEAGAISPEEAVLLLREVDELRGMLESCREERSRLQQMVWRKK